MHEETYSIPWITGFDGALVEADPFAASSAASAFIAGQAGFGKSVAAHLWLARLLAHGAQVVMQKDTLRNMRKQRKQRRRRARKLIKEHQLTEAEVQQLITMSRMILAAFDPDYRTNVTQLADDLDKSRPTMYEWADRAVAATIHALRDIRTGRPPKARRAETR